MKSNLKQFQKDWSESGQLAIGFLIRNFKAILVQYVVLFVIVVAVTLVVDSVNNLASNIASITLQYFAFTSINMHLFFYLRYIELRNEYPEAFNKENGKRAP